jgi:CheY-like chemotaxis protein
MRTILLVDDDPLEAFAQMSTLRRRFHDVERVADPAEVFCMVEQPQFAGRLGLVIADLHMPGLGGPAFVAELHARLPKLPVLVLGGSLEAPADYAEDGVRFLSQPVGPDEMLSAASQMLAQNSPPGMVQ